MEIISYISTTDGYTHYLFNNSLGVPFEFWLILICSACSLIYLILKKLIG